MKILQFELNATSGISSTMKTLNSTGIFSILVALALVAGCGQKDKEEKKAAGEEKKAAATQVAAKVNSTEITISQINTALSRNPNIAPEAAERAKREILNRLIDAELAKEEAVAKKLDRSPNVVQALEAAKTEILARAYVEQVAAAQPKPTGEEIKKYFVEHPELFNQRRVFNIEELTVQAQEGLADKLREQIATNLLDLQTSQPLVRREDALTSRRRAQCRSPADLRLSFRKIWARMATRRRKRHTRRHKEGCRRLVH